MENYEGQNSRVGKCGSIGKGYESQNKIQKMKWNLIEEEFDDIQEEDFMNRFIDPLINLDDGKVWGGVLKSNFDKTIHILQDLGYENITIENIVDDPDAEITYVIAADLTT